MKWHHVVLYFFPALWNIFKIVIHPTAFNRQMLRGKARRFYLVYFRRRYVEEVLLPKRIDGCKRTGACCELGFGCPAYDATHRLCTIHPFKPLVCKLFPISEEDLKDRDLVHPQDTCGFHFKSSKD